MSKLTPVDVYRVNSGDGLGEFEIEKGVPSQVEKEVGQGSFVWISPFWVSAAARERD